MTKALTLTELLRGAPIKEVQAIPRGTWIVINQGQIAAYGQFQEAVEQATRGFAALQEIIDYPDDETGPPIALILKDIAHEALAEEEE